ncbi:ABC transporter transmembrane domain-containing protein [Gordonia jinhuaensis]|uniref:ABC-type transport system ATPase n=1 Tax=Gordonia jinhuaensis TaxID=1517702 RepID=A0A916TKA6_9ACTN|nr:ABC transporter ATP-binding protein [Gordonia jinhuaensis]GGB47531.1 ABC-type transport system ATPase [Gordonia jinhuaensis]
MPLASGKRIAAAVRRSLRGYGWLVLVTLVVLVAAAALELVTPWGLGHMVDIASGSGGHRATSVWRTGGLMVAAAIASALLTGLGVALAGRLLETMLARLRESLVTTALSLPAAEVERAGTGDLVSRATDDVSTVGAAIGRALPALSTSSFAVGVSIVGLAALDWRFLAVVVVTLPMYVWAVRVYLARAPQVYAAERAAVADRAQHVLASIRGLDTARAFGLGRILAAAIAVGSWAAVVWAMRARLVQNRLWGRMNTAEFLGMATILVVGFYLVRDGSLTVGATTTAMLLFLQLFGPIGGVLMVFDDVQSALASLSRIVGVIDAADRVDDTGGPERLPHTRSERVVIDRVGFGYRPEHRVLHDISMTVDDGEHVAVVGASGAGKTTIAALIAGIHHPQSGRVAVRADRMVLMAQESHVFGGPLADDLRLVAPDAPDTTLYDALRTVGADDWVRRLPEGIDTVVGAEGHQLSPVQVQQIALARLVLADPDLVVLDEATSEAGSAHASILDAGAQAALAGRTAVIIAHRLEQASRADRILVMDRGRIIESGSHDQLLRRAGRYAQLWASWSADGRAGERR